MIKDLLLIVENSERADPTIMAAVAMAERLDAHLTLEILSPGVALVPGLAPFTSLYILEADLARDEAARMQTVAAMVKASKAKVSVVGIHGDLDVVAYRVGVAGPIADLILIGDADVWETSWLRRRAIETIILGGGTPLLILNSAAPAASIRHAAIGWKDTAEARRAIHDLVAIVEAGGMISVVAIRGVDHDAAEAASSVGEVVQHLRRHGFVSEAHVLLEDGHSEAEALEAFALRHDAELLAIGAFSHSRLREVIFGGVTRSLIERPWLPLLLSR